MQVSAIPSELRNKYPQFRSTNTAKPQDPVAVNLQFQKKIKELTEKLEKTSPLWPIMGDNLVTITRFDGTLSLQLDFLDLENLREREKKYKALLDWFINEFGALALGKTKAEMMLMRWTPSGMTDKIDYHQLRREYVQGYLDFLSDKENQYGHDPKNRSLTTMAVGELYLKGPDRYFVRNSQFPNLFQYLLNRDQATYSNLPKGEWDYQPGKLKALYIGTYRATREWFKY